MTNISNVLFDLDGTLTDSYPGIAECVKYALEKFGIHEYPDDTLRKFLGPPLVWSFMEYYGMTRSQAELAVNYYRELYNTDGVYKNSVYPGIHELLEYLKIRGFKLFVATSKPQYLADIVLDHFKLSQFFDCICGVDIKSAEISKTEIINNIADKFSLNRSNTAMAGDRKFDICAAKEAGVLSIGILHGFGSREEFQEYGADIIVKDAFELKQLFTEAAK